MTSTTSPAPIAGPTLHRTLTVWQVSIAGIGVILGAGAYALIGPAAAHAGNALWLAFVVLGVAAGLTAFFVRAAGLDAPAQLARVPGPSGRASGSSRAG